MLVEKKFEKKNLRDILATEAPKTILRWAYGFSVRGFMSGCSLHNHEYPHPKSFRSHNLFRTCVLSRFMKCAKLTNQPSNKEPMALHDWMSVVQENLDQITEARIRSKTDQIHHFRRCKSRSDSHIIFSAYFIHKNGRYIWNIFTLFF